ncbi:MAG: heterodisulfide reductase subunit A-like protein [Candidatus Fervidibacter sp.]|uniref:heterodisulfide reductase subunit A-like protein n=1 Tax=Candidatus Fervidibacter sp. TaxID=3100871 RepID=UPI00404B1BE4
MSEKKGLLLCNCQGTCPSFENMNIFEVLNKLRRDKVVDFVAVHPQLCSDDGEAFLKVLLEGKGIDKLYVAGCDPVMQRKLFRDVFEAAGFSKDGHKGIDIRNMTTDEAVVAIKKMLAE